MSLKQKKDRITSPKANANMAMLWVAVGSILTIVIGAFLLYIAIFINVSTSSAFDSTLNPASATGTFTFSGNTSTGDWANITSSALVNTSYYFNTTGIGKPIGALVVRVDGTTYRNDSAGSASALAAAINADSTFTGILSASNNVVNVTRVTASATGTGGNSYTISKTATNITVSGATLTGGVEGSSAWTSSKSNTMTGYLIIGIMFIIIGAIGCITVLMTMIGSIGGSGLKRG